MSKAEERLAAFLAKDDAPAKDWAFELEVGAAIARKRLARQAFETAVLGAVALLLVWTLWPVLTSFVADFAQPLVSAWPFVPAGAALIFAFLVVRRRFAL